MDFKDNFSKQSEYYARYRPVYPEALFTHLSSLTPTHDLAWDCACGNGQCAVQLNKFYSEVFASDPSEAQIKNAMPGKKIKYVVEKAEKSSLKSHSVDLIMVAQALHWFNLDLFYTEVKRVLKPGGIIVLLVYVNPRVSKEIDELVDDLHDRVLGEYWLPENRMVESGYKNLPFPFESLEIPPFTLEKVFKREDLVGHLRTWSALQRYIDKNGENPLQEFESQLSRMWDEKETKLCQWPLVIKVRRG